MKVGSKKGRAKQEARATVRTRLRGWNDKNGRQERDDTTQNNGVLKETDIEYRHNMIM